MDSALMAGEVFGPILAIQEFDDGDYDTVINYINTLPKALGNYYFGFNSNFFKRLTNETSSGALVQNDCYM